MDTLLKYSLDNDQRFFGTIKHRLTGYSFQISVITLAGRRDFDSPQKPNEDAFSVVALNNTLIMALFDGTSSLKPIVSLKDTTGARFASHYLKSVFENNIKGQTPKEIIRELNKLLLERNLKFEGATLLDTHTLPASTATVAQIDPDKQKVNISHVGDSFCIIFYKRDHSEFVTIDKNKAYDDQIFALMKEVSKEKHISPREARQDEKVKQALLNMFQDSHNKTDGTGQGIINGDPNAEQYIQDISSPLDSVAAIFLGSDGIVPPDYNEQKENDRGKIYTILKNGGLEELIRIKSEIEDNDPDRNFVRYKHADDATGIFIELNK